MNYNGGNFTKDIFLQYLFDNISEYKEYWLEESWVDTPEEADIGVEANILVRFTIDEIKKGNTKYLKFIFDLIEDMLNSDDEQVSEYAAYITFMEDLYNITSHDDSNILYNTYNPLLGPLSRQAMDNIHESPSSLMNRMPSRGKLYNPLRKLIKK